MSKNYSGKQVIKAGEKLISTHTPEEFIHAMDVLSYWRFSHEYPLEAALKVLQDESIKNDRKAIFAKRLKRHPSIVNKLKRFKDMKLKNMQDIGGCRAIVSNQKKLMQIVRTLKKRPEFKTDIGKIRFKDYLSNPKEDGYRGYHLIGRFPDENKELKNIEIQLRTTLQHDWATALEIVDLFTGQALKSNLGHSNWKKFFTGVSEQFAIMESIHLFETFDDERKKKEYYDKLMKNDKLILSCQNVQGVSKKLNVAKKFEAFAHSLNIVDGHIKERQVNGYVLVEVNLTKSSVNSTYFNREDNKDAEKMYIEAEKKADEQKDIVVALVSTTAVGGIKEAYPNYFADSTEFIKHLLFIINAPVIAENGIIYQILKQLNKAKL